MDKSLLTTPSKKSEPRIPFGWLVERGLLEPGTKLYDYRKRHSAKVRADGSIISAEHRGSIHKVGALVQDAAACNGWQFWHFPVEGKKLAPIDLLRQKLRSELN
jgi:modification methylase